MVHRVSYQVNQRIAQYLDHGAVYLRVLAAGHQPNWLVQLVGKVTNKARHLIEGLSYRNHPQPQRQILEGVEYLACMRDGSGYFLICSTNSGSLLGNDRVSDHQFSDHVYQIVQALSIYPHARFCENLFCFRRGYLDRLAAV